MLGNDYRSAWTDVGESKSVEAKTLKRGGGEVHDPGICITL